MKHNLFSKFVFSFAIVVIFQLHSFAQKTHAIANPFSSNLVSINQLDWSMDTSAKSAIAKMNITNKSTLDIQSISISLIAQNKQGVMLQSGQTRTIKVKTKEAPMAPQTTNTVTFERAFNNTQIDTIILKQVIIQFSNGSLEILK